MTKLHRNIWNAKVLLEMCEMQKYLTFEVVVCFCCTERASVFCVRCLWRGEAESRIQAIKTFGVSSPQAGNSHQNTSKSDKKWGMTRIKKQMTATLIQRKTYPFPDKNESYSQLLHVRSNGDRKLKHVLYSRSRPQLQKCFCISHVSSKTFVFHIFLCNFETFFFH